MLSYHQKLGQLSKNGHQVWIYSLLGQSLYKFEFIMAYSLDHNDKQIYGTDLVVL